jgi:hypothetical protein
MRLFFALLMAVQHAPCSEPPYHQLDFWIGRWNVYDRGDGALAGTSVIEKVLNGCAIEVDWHGADGSGEIRELFYYQKAAQRWRQIWVSDEGPTKERQSLPGSATLQFLGEVRELAGGSHLDRSTVTPQPDGRIHQLIEISRDGGKTWKTSFDGEYRAMK